jgi:hypothetical protein
MMERANCGREEGKEDRVKSNRMCEAFLVELKTAKKTALK